MNGIVAGVFCILWAFFLVILWFDPRREHSSVPTAANWQPPRTGPVKAGRGFAATL